MGKNNKIYFIGEMQPGVRNHGAEDGRDRRYKPAWSSSFFYTDSCSGGLYLAGVVTDKDIESKKQKGKTG
ncbi:MAG: hypothetical protein JXR72_06915 [Proteobacteria bacterium]|nr:hypothetical protein [Pseudomonadota bacterium]